MEQETTRSDPELLGAMAEQAEQGAMDEQVEQSEQRAMVEQSVQRAMAEQVRLKQGA